MSGIKILDSQEIAGIRINGGKTYPEIAADIAECLSGRRLHHLNPGPVIGVPAGKIG
ncbi:hypothetical protein [Azospira inquinata]|uniref:Uncharacterized protein n=1 Tax=Azospira inquinata TaxID=2785627 RepID=A0A975SNG9_9RHOO|nr:hypothetical protein [Azospira inquinata]QWT45071.1 hypothetical protein J8L76_08875 [Azospira inquinata]QWT49596.1 hypothetical protein Azoinq_03005 [Azospira inquinata]